MFLKLLSKIVVGRTFGVELFCYQFKLVVGYQKTCYEKNRVGTIFCGHCVFWDPLFGPDLKIVENLKLSENSHVIYRWKQNLILIKKITTLKAKNVIERIPSTFPTAEKR